MPKFIEFNDAIWRFSGANLRDKIPFILRTLRRFPGMKPDKAVVAHCYEPYWDPAPIGTVRWEVWKSSRKG